MATSARWMLFLLWYFPMFLNSIGRYGMLFCAVIGCRSDTVVIVVRAGAGSRVTCFLVNMESLFYGVGACYWLCCLIILVPFLFGLF